MNKTNIEFHCKILSGGKVVLVDCSGYESEIFVPLIVNNRITLQNVIVQRCCKQNYKDALKPLENKNKSGTRSYYSSIRRESPLAKSTPARINQSSKENRSPIRRYPTPDIVRRAVVENKNVSFSVPSFSAGVKVVRLYRNPTMNSPSKLAKIVPLSRTSYSTVNTVSTTQPQVLRNVSNVSSFAMLPSLQITSDSVSLRSPNQSFLMRRIHTPPGSATKWRKCITPQRTYIRRRNGHKTPNKLKSLSVKPLPLGKNGKLMPDFRLNATKHPPGIGGVIVQRRKLVIDNNLNISPRTFRHQLMNTKDLNRTDFQLPKTRKQLMCTQQTAFDLLTNSSYYPRIGKQMNAVFRQGCLNKEADTILKYQQLTVDIPPMKKL